MTVFVNPGRAPAYNAANSVTVTLHALNPGIPFVWILDVGDFNGDGSVDILTSDTFGVIKVFLALLKSLGGQAASSIRL